MEYAILPTNLFLAQLEGISQEARHTLEKKLDLVKLNPYRNKRIHGHNLLLFRILFEDGRKEKRFIYLVEKPTIMLICILDRNKDYKDLEGNLKRLGY
jgi:hypothetical protein